MHIIWKDNSQYRVFTNLWESFAQEPFFYYVKGLILLQNINKQLDIETEKPYQERYWKNIFQEM